MMESRIYGTSSGKREFANVVLEKHSSAIQSAEISAETHYDIRLRCVLEPFSDF